MMEILFDNFNLRHGRTDVRNAAHKLFADREADVSRMERCADPALELQNVLSSGFI